MGAILVNTLFLAAKITPTPFPEWEPFLEAVNYAKSSGSLRPWRNPGWKRAWALHGWIWRASVTKHGVFFLFLVRSSQVFSPSNAFSSYWHSMGITGVWMLSCLGTTFESGPKNLLCMLFDHLLECWKVALFWILLGNHPHPSSDKALIFVCSLWIEVIAGTSSTLAAWSLCSVWSMWPWKGFGGQNKKFHSTTPKWMLLGWF